MPSHIFTLAYIRFLGLNTVGLQAQAYDSHDGGKSVAESRSATPERSLATNSWQSPEHPSPLTELTQTVSALLGPSLAQAIRSTRDRVYPHGRAIPADTRRQLAPFFPRTVLEKVRYAMEWDPALDTLPALFMGSSPKSAMTLGDVILFRDAQGVADPLLWAHELTHVMQYQELGISAFATRYLEQGWELEAEAMAKADAISRQLSP
jgi:uncharacterized protein DUF4157